MRTVWLSLVLLLSFSALVRSPDAEAAEIAVVIDGPWDRNAEILETFRREIVDLLGDEFGVTLSDESIHLADWTLEGVRQALDDALADPDVDAVLGLGVLASNDLTHRTSLPKPAVAPFVIDPVVQGIPLSNGRSGVKNLSYVTAVSNFERDLQMFLEIVQFRKLAALVTAVAADGIPGLADRLRRIGARYGVEVTEVRVSQSGQEALDALPPGTEAVYVAPLLRLPEAEFDVIVAGLLERRLPSFSLLGRAEVERGILAGLTPEEEFERIARRTALNLQRILLGEEAAELPVHFSAADRLSLNIATARAIDVRPTWAILTIADRIDDRREVEREITLLQAVQEAIAANLDLRAEDHTVAAGEQEVKTARSALLPQLDVSARGIVIGEDQAAASFGQVAERTVSGSVGLSQVIFSDDALTNLDVARRIQVSREKERERVRLDIAAEAAAAYLSILRAKTLERIQRENLERTEANLALARAREAIGYSGPSDVYRWEGEIATQRTSVIDANAQRNVAEIALNRLLHRPAEEPFSLTDTDVTTSHVGLSDSRLSPYLEDPWSFRILREFLAVVAIENSPETQALDQAIAAQERLLANANRSFFLPTVGLQGELEHTLDRAGEGTDPPSGFDPPEDTSWNVALQATLPLFRGGSRISERRGAHETMNELRTQRAALAERIELRVRSAMHLAGASYAGIRLSRQAEDAARKNYDLVFDAYSKGVLSVLDLLDAQNAALVAGEAAANATYDFLLDYVEVERAAGYLTCLMDEAKLSDMAERLSRFRQEREER